MAIFSASGLVVNGMSFAIGVSIGRSRAFLSHSRLISALTAREGWRTIVVRDPETAIATAVVSLPLIAYGRDIGLPDQSGWELMRQLRQGGLHFVLRLHLRNIGIGIRLKRERDGHLPVGTV